MSKKTSYNILKSLRASRAHFLNPSFLIPGSAPGLWSRHLVFVPSLHRDSIPFPVFLRGPYIILWSISVLHDSNIFLLQVLTCTVFMPTAAIIGFENITVNVSEGSPFTTLFVAVLGTTRLVGEVTVSFSTADIIAANGARGDWWQLNLIWVYSEYWSCDPHSQLVLTTQTQ